MCSGSFSSIFSASLRINLSRDVFIREGIECVGNNRGKIDGGFDTVAACFDDLLFFPKK